MGMHANQSAEWETFKSIEQESLRASYEGAGREAYALGVPRNANPFTRPAYPQAPESDRQRRELLADYWWCGWDQAAATARRGRVRGNR